MTDKEIEFFLWTLPVCLYGSIGIAICIGIALSMRSKRKEQYRINEIIREHDEANKIKMP